MTEGRFFNDDESTHAATVAVLGQGARAALFGQMDAVGRYIKENEQWFHVIGVAGPQLTALNSTSPLPSRDLNNLIYVPPNAAIMRLDDSKSPVKGGIESMCIQMSHSA